MNYVLDIATWRSGSRGHTRMGKGETHLLNTDGYMCCLGQFAVQAGVHLECLKGVADPEDLARSLKQNYDWSDNIYDPNFVSQGEDAYLACNTEIVRKLIDANDDDHASSTASSRVDEIRGILEAEGHTLEVVNTHLLTQSKN